MPHPIQVIVTDDLKRNRLTVFFRALLVIPHYIVLFPWGIVVYIAIFIAWFAALFTRRRPRGPAQLHRVVHALHDGHVYAYYTLLANPYPPFSGSSTYPVDLDAAPAEKQGRLGVFFRIIIAIPALIISGILRYLGLAIAIIGWFAEPRASATCRRGCATPAHGRCASTCRRWPTPRC